MGSAADESQSLTKKRKTGASDESSPKTEEQPNVHSTNMEATADVPPIVKMIQTDASLKAPTSQEMKIYLKVMKTIALGVNTSDSIEDVKAKYRDMEGDTSKNLELFYAGDHLRNDKNLIDYGVQDGSTVHMFLHSEAKIQIQLKMKCGRRTKLDVLKWDTVEMIKATIRDSSSYLKNRQIDLIYCGKQLEDCRTLAFYNIQHDSIVHVVTAEEDRFDLRIITPKNGTISFKVSLSYSIGDVKLMIESMLGIPMDDQDIIFEEMRKFYDGMTLRECKVSEFTIMELNPYY